MIRKSFLASTIIVMLSLSAFAGTGTCETECTVTEQSALLDQLQLETRALDETLATPGLSAAVQAKLMVNDSSEPSIQCTKDKPKGCCTSRN